MGNNGHGQKTTYRVNKNRRVGFIPRLRLKIRSSHTLQQKMSQQDSDVLQFFFVMSSVFDKVIRAKHIIHRLLPHKKIVITLVI